MSTFQGICALGRGFVWPGLTQGWTVVASSKEPFQFSYKDVRKRALSVGPQTVAMVSILLSTYQLVKILMSGSKRVQFYASKKEMGSLTWESVPKNATKVADFLVSFYFQAALHCRTLYFWLVVINKASWCRMMRSFWPLQTSETGGPIPVSKATSTPWSQPNNQTADIRYNLPNNRKWIMSSLLSK